MKALSTFPVAFAVCVVLNPDDLGPSEGEQFDLIRLLFDRLNLLETAMRNLAELDRLGGRSESKES